MWVHWLNHNTALTFLRAVQAKRPSAAMWQHCVKLPSVFEPNPGQHVLRASYKAQRSSKTAGRLLSTSGSAVLAGWPAEMRSFSSDSAAAAAAPRFQQYLNSSDRKPAPKRAAPDSCTPLRPPPDATCVSSKRARISTTAVSSAAAVSPEPVRELAVYKKKRKRQLLFLARVEKKDRAVRCAIRELRSRPGYGDSTKAARKQKRSKAQTMRRDAHRVRKAEEKIQWYQQQFERLNKGIHDATTNELLTISDEDEKEPTTKQLQRVMYQATGLRYFYSLCIDKYNARLLVKYNRIDEALLVELANQAGASVFVCGSTILTWHRNYIKYDAHFPPDGRGSYEREHLLCNEDLLLKFKTKMQKMAGDETLTVAEATVYVNTELLAGDYSKHLKLFLDKLKNLQESPQGYDVDAVYGAVISCPNGEHSQLLEQLDEEIEMMLMSGCLTRDSVADFVQFELMVGEAEILKKCGLRLPIGAETVRSWLHWKTIKGVHREAVKSYYTDRHEEATNVRYRGHYCERQRDLELRMPVWVHLTKKQHSALKAKQPELPGGYQYNAEDGTAMHELHVDDNEVFESFSRSCGEMGGELSVRFPRTAECKYNHPESVCKCNLPLWHSGQDESIFKAFQRSKRQWVIDGVCGLRKKTDGPGEMVSAFQDRHRGFGFPITEAELERFNEHRAGLCTGLGSPPITESAGIRFLQYGSMVSTNGSVTGKEGWWDWEKFELQLIDFLDLFEFLYPGYQLQVEIDWSAGHSKFRAGALSAKAMNTEYGGKPSAMRDTVIEREEGFLGPNPGRTLQVGDTQRMVFAGGDPAPHFKPDAPKYDQPATDGKKAVEGYIGKPKGLKQVLWERGLWKDGMIQDIKDNDKKGRDKSFSMVEVSFVDLCVCEHSPMIEFLMTPGFKQLLGLC